MLDETAGSKINMGGANAMSNKDKARMYYCYRLLWLNRTS